MSSYDIHTVCNYKISAHRYKSHNVTYCFYNILNVHYITEYTEYWLILLNSIIQTSPLDYFNVHYGILVWFSN